jgi:hypothetical protein
LTVLGEEVKVDEKEQEEIKNLLKPKPNVNQKIQEQQSQSVLRMKRGGHMKKQVGSINNKKRAN